MKTITKAEMLKDAVKKIIVEAKSTLKQAGVDRILIESAEPVFAPETGRNVYSIEANNEYDYAIKNETRSKVIDLGYTDAELDNYMIVDENVLHSFLHNIFESVYSAVDLLTLKKINTSPAVFA